MRKAALTDRDKFATKADLAGLRYEHRADLYRALWIQGAGIVAVLAALRFLPIRPSPGAGAGARRQPCRVSCFTLCCKLPLHGAHAVPPGLRPAGQGRRASPLGRACTGRDGSEDFSLLPSGDSQPATALAGEPLAQPRLGVGVRREGERGGLRGVGGRDGVGGQGQRVHRAVVMGFVAQDNLR